MTGMLTSSFVSFPSGGCAACFIDDYSVDLGYSFTGTVSITGGVLDYNYPGDGGTDGASFDLQDADAFGCGHIMNATLWTMRWKLTIDCICGTPASDAINIAIGIFDCTSESANTADDSIAFIVQKAAGGDSFRLIQSNNANSIGGSGQVCFCEVPTTQTYYIDLRRTSDTNANGSIYSDACFMCLTESKCIAISGSSISNLRYLGFRGRLLNRTGSICVSIDDMSIWDGINV